MAFSTSVCSSRRGEPVRSLWALRQKEFRFNDVDFHTPQGAVKGYGVNARIYQR